MSVYLVGAGSGRAELITEKGKKCIEKADVIIYDSLISVSLLNYSNKHCKLVYAGKRANNHHLSQTEINALIVKYAKMYKTVVRLKGGDPFVFGRGGEEAQYLKQNNIDFEIVPGVSSCYSVPEYCGIPVTHRGVSSSFHVITGQNKKDGEGESYRALAALNGTLVFLMGIRNISYIASELIKYGKSPNTPAAVISHGTLVTQQVITAPLGEISKKAKNAPMPGIIVIGDVVELYDELSWTDKGGLYGVRILATGTQKTNDALKKAASEYNGTVDEISLIYTEETENIKEVDIKDYSHIVFFSVNGIDAFFKKRFDVRKLYNVRIAVTGKACADELLKHGIYADIIPKQYNSTALAKELEKELTADSRVLVICQENSVNAVGDMLRKKHIAFKEIVLYRTEMDMRKKELLNLAGDYDYITLMSGAAARAFKAMYDKDINLKLIAIGKHTEQEAKKIGLNIYKTAKEATAEGIIEAIKESLNDNTTA